MSPDRGVPPDEIRAAESDPRRDVDILAVHRQALREPTEPGEGAEPGPWWFWACAVAALVFGGFYMGRYTGVFAGEPAVHAPVSPRALLEGARRGGGAPRPPAPVSGEAVYGSTCAACHQLNGEGMPGLFPPLAGAERVRGDAGRLVRLVLHGLTGPVTVRGFTYDGQMPPWKQPSDSELAAVLSYVRSSWGNSSSAVSDQDVARERAATAARFTPWTVPELGP